MQEADFGEAIVIGTRNSSSGGGGGGGGGSGGGGNYQEENRILPDPPPQPTQLPLVPVAEHEEDCSEADGAAVDMANRVKGGSGQSDPLRTGSGRTWQTVELGALLIRNDDGTFGAANDTIHSNDSANAVALPSPTGFSRAEGILHNHPYQQGNELSRNLSRFPRLRISRIENTLQASPEQIPIHRRTSWIAAESYESSDFRIGVGMIGTGILMRLMSWML